MKDESFISETHQRFLDFVEIPDLDPEGCWEWKGRQVLCRDGLVAAIGLQPGGPVIAANKKAYELFIGPVQDGLVIRTSCGNPNCVNPDHLCLAAAPLANKHDRTERIAAKGGLMQQGLLARPSLAKVRGRSGSVPSASAKSCGRSAVMAPARAEPRFRTVTTIKVGKHQYLRFGDRKGQA